MSDAINPEHYQFSNGAQVIDISENLTSNGGQAVQYIARSTRLDAGKNKHKTVNGLIEDLTKAVWFCSREIERLEAARADEPVARLDEAEKSLEALRGAQWTPDYSNDNTCGVFK